MTPKTWVWCEFVCHNCARTAPGRFTSTGRVPIRELKESAVRWAFVGKDTYCPQCAAAALAAGELAPPDKGGG